MTRDGLEPGWELRFDLAGRAAVRVAGGPVAPRHVEPVPPAAPWLAQARCGRAAGWLLAPAPPADPARAREWLERTVERRAALELESRERERAASGAELLDGLTHRLRGDVTALHGVADGALHGLFAPDEVADVQRELASAVREAQKRLTEARAVMSVLAPGARVTAEPIVEILREELEAAGRTAPVRGPDGERPLALVPGAGWAACARVLAADLRLAAFTVEPDPAGWRVRAREAGAATTPPAAALAHVRRIVVAAGGTAPDGHGPGLELTVPAAPPPQ